MAYPAKIKGDPQEVINRYLQGESTVEIAKSFGATRWALNYWLLKHAEEQWRDAQMVKAMRRKDEAEELLDKAVDVFEVSKARELLKSAQWELERICKRYYGTESATNQSQVTINIGIKRDADITPEVTIDAQPN